MFDSVLVANRGEIAVRVIRTLKALGIRSIAVYSDADADAPHVRLADEAIRIGPAPAAESYLSIERVLEAAQGAGAEAIHPGYGFLSENPAFARACARARLVFIGPPPEAMERLGDKVSAKLLARRRACRCWRAPAPGPHRRGDRRLRRARRPASADGQGGRGRRRARHAHRALTRRAARRAGGGSPRGRRRLRRRHAARRALRRARAPYRGPDAGATRTATWCTSESASARSSAATRRWSRRAPRRPCPPELRERLGAAAAAFAQRAGYVGAGTAEFLVPADDPERFSFLEVNARLQVEHPVTEEVTGLDLVEQQLRIAAGEPIDLWQDDSTLHGHAIEVRVCAEDPASGFLPATGRVVGYREPSGTGVRVDSGIALGSEVGAAYDSLLLKVIATGRGPRGRARALCRARSASCGSSA